MGRHLDTSASYSGLRAPSARRAPLALDCLHANSLWANALSGFSVYPLTSNLLMPASPRPPYSPFVMGLPARIARQGWAHSGISFYAYNRVSYFNLCSIEIKVFKMGVMLCYGSMRWWLAERRYRCLPVTTSSVSHRSSPWAFWACFWAFWATNQPQPDARTTSGPLMTRCVWQSIIHNVY